MPEAGVIEKGRCAYNPVWMRGSRSPGIDWVAVAATGVCLAAGLACQGGERSRSGVQRADPTSVAIPVAAPASAAADATPSESVAAAMAEGTWCSSFLDLELPKAVSLQIGHSIQRCAATVPAEQGRESAHLRIRIEANGRVRDLRAFD